MRNFGIALVVLLAGCSDDGRPRTADGGREAFVEIASPEPGAQRAPATAAAPPSHPEPVAEPTPTVASPAAPPASPSGLEVVDATFTHGVERRAPIDRVSELRVGERVTYLVVMKNRGPATGIVLEWVRDGRVIGRQSLAVGTSPAWRTWALRSVVGRDAATGIEVRVVDADGNVLRTDHARVTPPSEPTA